MAVPCTGPLKLGADISTEFGGGTPDRLSEYYRGGGLVPDHGNTASIPTSGEIKFSQFQCADATGPTTPPVDVLQPSYTLFLANQGDLNERQVQAAPLAGSVASFDPDRNRETGTLIFDIPKNTEWPEDGLNGITGFDTVGLSESSPSTMEVFQSGAWATISKLDIDHDWTYFASLSPQVKFSNASTNPGGPGLILFDFSGGRRTQIRFSYRYNGR